MFKNFKFPLSMLMASALFFSCADEAVGPQGEPGLEGAQGPQGAEGPAGEPGSDAMVKNGYFEGQVKGTRKDGVAFSEAFKYEYAWDTATAFTEKGGQKFLEVSRNIPGSDNYLHFESKLDSENNLVITGDTYDFSFSFEKVLDANSLFSIRAVPYFQDTEAFVIEISDEENEKYKFQKETKSLSYWRSTYYGPGASGEDAFSFYSWESGRSYRIEYSAVSGMLLGIYDYETDQYIEQGELFDLYNQIKFSNSPELGINVFYDVATGDPLYQEIPAVPADQVTITNYVHDAASGIITFDFEVNMSGIIVGNYNRRNTTGNDLTITGSFNSGGKVYKNTVYRTSAGK